MKPSWDDLDKLYSRLVKDIRMFGAATVERLAKLAADALKEDE